MAANPQTTPVVLHLPLTRTITRYFLVGIQDIASFRLGSTVRSFGFTTPIGSVSLGFGKKDAVKPRPITATTKLAKILRLTRAGHLTTGGKYSHRYWPRSWTAFVR